MDQDIKDKTRSIAALYFKGAGGEKPFDLWRAFDPELAKAFSIFITGRLYARGKLPHPTRQLVAVAALTALGQTEELRLHIRAGLNVGCRPDELAEAIFQTGVYAGIPAMNKALRTLRSELEASGQWPPAAPPKTAGASEAEPGVGAREDAPTRKGAPKPP